MRISKLCTWLAFLIAFGALTARAEAHQVRYEGMHPIPGENGGGFCQIDFPHVHVFEPQRADVLYRNHEGGYAFVGDPVPYGYEGPKHAFYGPHPMQDENGDLEYCYLEGPHYHTLPPPVTAAASFKLKGGVYFYGGHFPQTYYEMKPRYAKINVVYRPLEYPRPVVIVQAPEAQVVVDEPQRTVVVPSHETVVAGGGVGVSAGIGFHAGIGGGVMIGGPPPPSVVVVERQPRTVYVEERRPRTVYVEERHPVEVIRVKERHHDRDEHHDEHHEEHHDRDDHGHAWGKKW